MPRKPREPRVRQGEAPKRVRDRQVWKFPPGDFVPGGGFFTFPARPYPYRVLSVYLDITTGVDADPRQLRLEVATPSEEIVIARYPATLGIPIGNGIMPSSQYNLTWSTGPSLLWDWDNQNSTAGTTWHMPIPRDLWITTDVQLRVATAVPADVISALNLYVEP